MNTGTRKTETSDHRQRQVQKFDFTDKNKHGNLKITGKNAQNCRPQKS